MGYSAFRAPGSAAFGRPQLSQCRVHSHFRTITSPQRIPVTISNFFSISTVNPSWKPGAALKIRARTKHGRPDAFHQPHRTAASTSNLPAKSRATGANSEFCAGVNLLTTGQGSPKFALHTRCILVRTEGQGCPRSARYRKCSLAQTTGHGSPKTVILK